MVSLIVILAASELLYELDGGHRSYADTLHATALMTISGEPLRTATTYGMVLEVLLAVYSVVVVAALAGTFGAYFVDQRSRPSPDGGATSRRDLLAPAAGRADPTTARPGRSRGEYARSRGACRGPVAGRRGTRRTWRGRPVRSFR